MTSLLSRLEKNWRDIIGAELDRRSMMRLEEFLRSEKAAKNNIYPNDSDIFKALNLTAFNDVKVVILGQDPYHGKGQANGLCFSVPNGKDIPRSLRNIYKEIEAEYEIKMPHHGDLTGWATQGVLLLNVVLTVQLAKPGSHQCRGWEEFTDAIIRAISEEREHLVFLLWGLHARKKVALIDCRKHLVLETSHPSPLSFRHGFDGCGHFKKTNGYLMEHGIKPIEWQKI